MAIIVDMIWETLHYMKLKDLPQHKGKLFLLSKWQMIVSIVWILVIVIISLFIQNIKKLRHLSKFLAIHELYYGTNLTVCFGLPF